MNNKLGGKLIGYEIWRDGTLKKAVRFEQPIHNTITKACLNNLLTYDGTNTVLSVDNNDARYLSIFVYAGSGTRYGVLNYSALGDGSGTTSTNDVALKHQVGDYTSTKHVGTGYCDTYDDNENSIMRFRISHQHSIANTFTIKEIGWFNRYYDTDVYDLSARVTLDSPISVESGDLFVSIYEIDVAFQQETVEPDFFNMNVPYRKCNAVIHMTTNGPVQTYPRINTRGNPYVTGAWWQPNISLYPLYLGIHPEYCIKYMTNVNAAAQFNGKFPAIPDRDDWYRYSSDDVSYQVAPYTTNSFYRDITIILSPAWAANSDLYGILINGTAYIFGYYDETNDNTWVPQALHKDDSTLWTIKQRQSWSTDLLSPTV